MNIPKDVSDMARELGYGGVVPIKKRDGETVYYLDSDEGAIGIPQFLAYRQGIVVLLSPIESLDMLEEPDFLRVDE